MTSNSVGNTFITVIVPTLFCVLCLFAFCILRSPTVCVASGDLKPHSHRWASFAFAVSRGVEPSALHCARMGSFCALVNLSQFLRCGESSLALKRFFSIRPLPSSLWLDPLVRIEGDSFSLLVSSWFTQKASGSAWSKASSWVGTWLVT